MNQDEYNYNRWLGHGEPLPARCRTWIVNPSGHRYAVHRRVVGRRLVAKWNRAATSERDKYKLREV